MKSMKRLLGIIIKISLLTAVFIILPFKCVYADGVHKEEFMNDDALISINIDPDFTYIGARAYYGCVNLESVVIPEGVTRIGESAFAMCPKLSYVSIPSSVKTIEPGAFAGDTALSGLSFSGYNEHFVYSNGVLYDDEVKKVISFIPGNGRKVYHMPGSIKSIDKYAFWGAKDLEKVVVSKLVTTITPYDFAYCSGLKYIYMPSFIKSVQEYAFRDCKNLEYLYFGYKNVAIDPTAFFNCGRSFNTVSGAGVDTFNAKFVYESELEAEDEPEVKSTSSNKASKSSASGNSPGGTSSKTATTSGNSTGNTTDNTSSGSTVGKWDPNTTTYVTRNPYIKSGIDALSQRLAGNNGIFPNISWPNSSSTANTPLITLP